MKFTEKNIMFYFNKIYKSTLKKYANHTTFTCVIRKSQHQLLPLVFCCQWQHPRFLLVVSLRPAILQKRGLKDGTRSNAFCHHALGGQVKQHYTVEGCHISKKGYYTVL